MPTHTRAYKSTNSETHIRTIVIYIYIVCCVVVVEIEANRTHTHTKHTARIIGLTSVFTETGLYVLTKIPHISRHAVTLTHTNKLNHAQTHSA